MALACLPIHLYVLFANCDIFNRKEKVLEKVRKKVKEKFPDASYRIQELTARRYIMRRKIIKSATMFVVGLVLIIIADIYYDKFGGWKDVTIAITAMIGGYSIIFGVCSFAAAMHDPLTPQEAAELEEKDRIEKGR